MRLTVSDLVSPSYFVATAAVELGLFRDEGVDAEVVPPPADPSRALQDGEIDFFGGSPYLGLRAFPDWEGGRLLCALSHGAYWQLALRSDIDAVPEDLTILRGLRIATGEGPGLLLRQLLIESGLEPARNGIQIVSPPRASGDHNWAREGARVIEQNLADGFWGNAMRAEYAVRHGLARVILDLRRGGPPAVRAYTFPALVTTDRLIAAHPEAAAGAVRAVMRAQRALAALPDLATQVGRGLFPAEEAELLGELISRDVPYYRPVITTEMVDGASRFALLAGLNSRPVPYEQVVATGFTDLWKAG